MNVKKIILVVPPWQEDWAALLYRRTVQVAFTLQFLARFVNCHLVPGADKSLARPERKQITATKLQLSQATQKNPECCPSNQDFSAATTPASDEKWRPFTFFFPVGSGQGLISTAVVRNISVLYTIRFINQVLHGTLDNECKHCKLGFMCLLGIL
jgi:hypothetical protein